MSLGNQLCSAVDDRFSGANMERSEPTLRDIVNQIEEVWRQIGGPEDLHVERDRLLRSACHLLKEINAEKLRLEHILKCSREELTDLARLLEEPSAPLIEELPNANLKDRVAATSQALERMRSAKVARLAQFLECRRKIARLERDLRVDGATNPGQALFSQPDWSSWAEPSLGLKCLEDLKKKVEVLEREKVELIQKIVTAIEGVRQLCRALGIDFVPFLESVHPSLTMGLDRKAIVSPAALPSGLEDINVLSTPTDKRPAREPLALKTPSTASSSSVGHSFVGTPGAGAGGMGTGANLRSLEAIISKLSDLKHERMQKIHHLIPSIASMWSKLNTSEDHRLALLKGLLPHTTQLKSSASNHDNPRNGDKEENGSVFLLSPVPEGQETPGKASVRPKPDERDFFTNCTRDLLVIMSDSELEANGLLHETSLKQLEAEQARLLADRCLWAKDIYVERRSFLEAVCKRTALLPPEDTSPAMVEPSLESGALDPSELLDKVDRQIELFEEEERQRKDVLLVLRRWQQALEQETWLEAFEKDENRYSPQVKGQHEKFRRAEQARKILKKLPALIADVRSSVLAYEEQHGGRPFLYMGRPLHNILDDDQEKRAQKQAEERRLKELKKEQHRQVLESQARYGPKTLQPRVQVAQAGEGVKLVRMESIVDFKGKKQPAEREDMCPPKEGSTVVDPAVMRLENRENMAEVREVVPEGEAEVLRESSNLV